MQKKKINVVWFKRDLRLKDHQPLKRAAESVLPTLLLYLFEPSLVSDPHYGDRHWRFVWESLEEMKDDLRDQGCDILIAYEEAETLFQKINSLYDVQTVYSHEETGINLTYQRDLRMADLFNEWGIHWDESPTNAVQRGLMNRDGWRKAWKSIMDRPLENPDLERLNSLALNDKLTHDINTEVPDRFKTRNENFQPGGETKARELLDSFVLERCADYNKSISAPGPARNGCSRLSPHITWGNLSIRQIVQYADRHYDEAPSKRGIRSFRSRLGWHCHFVQKFESEPRIEFENMNRGYDDIRSEWNDEKL
ncbi:deoxyribodipyrimidine photo-lyase [Rhodohalobacter sp.]|uniref:deoxyribodipyrimidine photo-lyase n=1 Tax=Rhodohalobacter sp. TaxID=1974210 RepID=UPI002ACE5593|nr:deoxyribodipyrimidine photo-lyase [Rhodohalobacter sp.]MDZ7756529.1 deoxyribodipyrimidine photo-lyase [Rhodohalobacter sp.]